MSLPPSAPLRTNSQPPLKPEGNYSDRFKNRTAATVVAPTTTTAEPTADATSYKDFPVLKGPIVIPNLVVMPPARPAISFATKVKQLVATETAAKEKAAAAALLKAEEAKKDEFHRNLYASIFTHTRTAPVSSDSWDQEESGTPEFGREEFLRFEDGHEDYENHEEENN